MIIEIGIFLYYIRTFLKGPLKIVCLHEMVIRFYFYCNSETYSIWALVLQGINGNADDWATLSPAWSYFHYFRTWFMRINQTVAQTPLPFVILLASTLVIGAVKLPYSTNIHNNMHTYICIICIHKVYWISMQHLPDCLQIEENRWTATQIDTGGSSRQGVVSI